MYSSQCRGRRLQHCLSFDSHFDVGQMRVKMQTFSCKKMHLEIDDRCWIWIQIWFKRVTMSPVNKRPTLLAAYQAISRYLNQWLAHIHDTRSRWIRCVQRHAKRHGIRRTTFLLRSVCRFYLMMHSPASRKSPRHYCHALWPRCSITCISLSRC